jgi:transcriptional regulator with XRE-family HTH domain
VDCSSDIGAFSVKNYTSVKKHVTRALCNHLQMPRATVAPASRYAENLKILLALHEKTVAEVAAAAKLTPKQIYNLMNVSHDPRIKGLEKVANAFGLTTWQMLATDLTDKPAENRLVLMLLEYFAQADEAGKATIMNVAEIVARQKLV